MDDDEIGKLTQGNMKIMNPVSETKLILAGKYANLKPGMSDAETGPSYISGIRRSVFAEPASNCRKSWHPAQEIFCREPGLR